MPKLDSKQRSIVAMIPARMGSKRLLMKNLALLNGKPLIYYAIQAAKKSGVFNRIIVNSENILFSTIAKRYEVEFYRRPGKYATSSAKSDSVVYDFIRNNPCDIIVWVNPIAPLQTGEEIRDIVKYFLKKNLDSLITVKDEQVHCVYKGKPVNFEIEDVFARTQELTPVQPFVYSVMMWRSSIFLRAFEKKGYALLSGKTDFYPVSKLSAVIIKKKEDLKLADYVMRLASHGKDYKVRYGRTAQNPKGR